jgi:hypothetical protein
MVFQLAEFPVSDGEFALVLMRIVAIPVDESLSLVLEPRNT